MYQPVIYNIYIDASSLGYGGILVQDKNIKEL